MTWDSIDTIVPALRRWSAKELARWADVSEKTATAWREGRNEPRLSHAMRLGLVAVGWCRGALRQHIDIYRAQARNALRSLGL